MYSKKLVFYVVIKSKNDWCISDIVFVCDMLMEILGNFTYICNQKTFLTLIRNVSSLMGISASYW